MLNMSFTTLRWQVLFKCLDIVLYLSIFVPLSLSLLGKLNFEFGQFNCTDPSIRLEERDGTVGTASLLLFYFLLPFLMICIVQSIHSISKKSNNLRNKVTIIISNIYFIYSRYGVWATLNLLLNEVLKVLSAVPRPHFISTCQPDWQTITPLCAQNSGMVRFSRSLCLSEDTGEIFDAMKSWPSGHAQLSFFAAVFIVVYIESNISDDHSVILKRWLQALVLIFPAYTSTSRIHDHKHHVFDVLCGSIIGSILSFFMTYKLNYMKISKEENNQTERTTTYSESLEKVKRPSRMQLIQPEFGRIEEMESEFGRSENQNNLAFNQKALID